MRFLAVNQPAKATIFGQDYWLKPLDPQIENLEDILVTDDFSASELFSRHDGLLLEAKFDTASLKGFPRIVDKLSDLKTGGRVLIMRNGGIGDHILFLPALGVFREMFPHNSEIWLSTQKEKHPIFYDNNNISRLYPMPLRLDTLLKADYMIDFSGGKDRHDFTQLHMTDYFLNFLGIDYRTINDKNPRMKWNPRKSYKSVKLFQAVRKETPHKPAVLLNWKASNSLRDLPPDKLLFLVKSFKDVLFVVAQPKAFAGDTARLVKEYGNRVLDCSPYMDSLEDYITTIANCDAVVSTDTGTGHLSEALGKPGLIIYGPTDDDRFIRYYDKTRCVRAEYSGKTCQSPCGLIKSEEGCPESVLLGTSHSPCLLSIPDEMIYQHFKKFCDEVLK